MKNTLQKILLLIMISALTSCATFFRPPSPVTTAPAETRAQRQAQLQALTNWQLTGAFSILYQNKLSMANIVWQQSGEQFYQRISGPFSIGGVRIQGDSHSVTLWRSATQSYTAPTPESLLDEQLGLKLPISNLKYWVRNIPVPGVPASTVYDNQNRLVSLQQSGWQVTYTAFTTVNNIDLPSRIELVNPELQIKVVIKRWDI